MLRTAVNDALPGEPEQLPRSVVVRWWRPFSVGVVAVVLAAVVVVCSQVLPPTETLLIADLTSLVSGGGAFVAFAVTSRTGPAEQRRWRLLFAVAMAIWFAGQVLWTWHRSVDMQSMPFPDVANVLFLALPICSFIALLRLSRRERSTTTSTPRRALMLDSLIIVSSGIALTWETVFSPSSGEVSATELLLADVYTIADLVLITGVTLLAVTLRSMWRVPVAVIMAGLIAIGFSDTMYMYAVSAVGEAPVVADLGYMVGPSLLLLAAIIPDRRFSRYKPPLALWGLPYSPLVAVCGYVVYTTALNHNTHPVEVYFLGGIVALVVLRQLLTQRQVHSAHQQLAYQATHDPLTGMANRLLLLDRLARALHRARGGSARSGVYFLDVDRFKELNDTLGHNAGDTILRTLAARLRTNVRETDTIARLGGDEFVLLLDPAPQDPESLANRLAATVREPISLDGRSELYCPSASIGYVRLEPDDTPEHALARADAAMYRAKRTRNHTFTSEVERQ